MKMVWFGALTLQVLALLIGLYIIHFPSSKKIKYKVTYFEDGRIEVQVLRGRKVSYLSSMFASEQDFISERQRFENREEAQKAIDNHKASLTEIKSFIID